MVLNPLKIIAPIRLDPFGFRFRLSQFQKLDYTNRWRKAISKNHTMNRTCSILLALLAISTLCACGKSEVQYYEIPKETRAVANADGLPPGHPPTGSLGPGITWNTPEGWVEGGSQQGARASFHIHQDENHLPGDVVVLDFPPHVAQIEDFTRLLSDQLELQVDAGQTEPGEIEIFTAGDNEYSVIRLTSEKALIDGEHKKSILAAILRKPDRIWLVNLTGAESVVVEENERFFEFLRSIEFKTEDIPAASAGNMADQSLPSGSVSNADNPDWVVPDSWEPGRVSNMRRGSFQVRGDNGLMVDIAVTSFPGDVGGMLANINRWRGQIGLGPITAGMVNSVVGELEINGKSCKIVDIVGTDPPSGKILPQRSLVGTFSHEGNSWFFKMSGDASLVEVQEQTFMDFLNSVRF